MANRVLWSLVANEKHDDGLTTFYNVDLDATPTHIQHNGITRTGVRFDAGASGIGTSVKSVHVRFRKYGLPTGNITVNIRKGSDDTVAATLGTYPIESFPANVESSFVVGLRSNTYNMVATDLVTVEFPSNATNGFEITTHSTASNPANFTGRSYNGTTYASTTDPPCITVKG